MKKLFKIKNITFIIVILYAIIAAFAFLGMPPFGGDESYFYKSEVLSIKNLGFFKTLTQGTISLPYILLVYPFTLLFDNVIGMRLFNVILIILLVLYFLRICKIKKINFWNAYVFFFSTVGYFYIGTNDLLFFVGLIVYLSEFYYYIKQGKMNSPILAFSGLIISFFTRQLIFIYLPILIVTLFVLFRRKFNFKDYYKIPALLFLLFVILNIPSILSNGSLSYDSKKAPEGVSWSQRQYLAQLLVNEGKIPNYTHPSWEETLTYLKQNGQNSLPDGMISAIFFDFHLTLKEFVKDLISSLFYSFRSISFALFLPFMLLLFRKKYNIYETWFVSLSMFYVFLTFSFIIISFVELRWLCPVFVLAILYYGDKIEEKDKYLNYFSMLNNIMIILMITYSLITNDIYFRF